MFGCLRKERDVVEEILKKILTEVTTLREDVSTLKGDMELVKDDICELKEGQKETNQRLDGVDQHLIGVDQRLDRMENKMDAVYERTAVNTEQQIKSDLVAVKVEQLETDVKLMKKVIVAQ